MRRRSRHARPKTADTERPAVATRCTGAFARWANIKLPNGRRIRHALSNGIAVDGGREGKDLEFETAIREIAFEHLRSIRADLRCLRGDVPASAQTIRRQELSA